MQKHSSPSPPTGMQSPHQHHLRGQVRATDPHHLPLLRPALAGRRHADETDASAADHVSLYALQGSVPPGARSSSSCSVLLWQITDLGGGVGSGGERGPASTREGLRQE